jgi:hypothetical protein
MSTITGFKIRIMRDSAEIMLHADPGRPVRLRFRADQEPENVDTGTWLDADVEPSLFDSVVDVLRNEQEVLVKWTPDSVSLTSSDWSPVGTHRPVPADEASGVNFS